MRENILKSQSYAFALRIVKMYRYLCSNKEYVLSKQVLRSGMAVGALVAESEFAQSKSNKGIFLENTVKLKLAQRTNATCRDKRVFICSSFICGTL